MTPVILSCDPKASVVSENLFVTTASGLDREMPLLTFCLKSVGNNKENKKQ